MRWTILVFLLLFLFLRAPAWAQSDYVLPYPSSMPGSKLYSVHKAYEHMLGFWYFGNFGKFKYNLKYSDKYLVEAKTLFEYKQYLLAYQALEKSNRYYVHIPETLRKAEENNKNISEKESMFKDASLKHVEILSLLKKTTPDEFKWVPENKEHSLLQIHELLDKSIELRK